MRPPAVRDTDRVTGAPMLVARSIAGASDPDQGFPIIVQSPGEWGLVFGVLTLLGLPLYLAYRRRHFRRHTER